MERWLKTLFVAIKKLKTFVQENENILPTMKSI